MILHWIYAHLIGDFIIQNDWMAKGKKNRSWICGIHVITYTIPFVLTGLSWKVLGLIALQHFLQDRTNIVVWFMNIKGSGEFATGACSPWSIILIDNILHILWILLVSSLF